jgi:hypothetical protein
MSMAMPPLATAARLASPKAGVVARDVDRAARRASVDHEVDVHSFEELESVATPLKDLSNVGNIVQRERTPWWGCPASQTKSVASGKSSGGASWQTIRAGILSPPPLISTLLTAADDDAAAGEDEPTATGQEEPAATGEEPPTGAGGWLVDLVEGIDGLFSQPSTSGLSLAR